MEKQFQTPACLKISGCRQQTCLTLMKKEEQKEEVKKEEEEGDCPSSSRAGGIAVGPRGEEHPRVGAAVGKGAGFSLPIRAKKSRHLEGSKKGS